MLECFVNQTTMGEPAVECGSYARIRRNSATNLQPQFDLLAFELSPTFEELPVYSRRKSVFAEQYDPEADESTEKVVHPKTDKQRQRLGEAVRNILLFRALEEQQMREVLDAMYERKVSPGEVVIQQGDDGDNFYVIESGIYHAFVGSDKEKGKWNMVGKYENSGSFGELALMYNMPRAATVKAATDGSLWVMLLHNNFDKVHHLKKFEVYGIVRPRNGDQAWLSARKLLMSLREGVGLLEYAMNKGKLKLFKDRHTFRRIVLKSAFIKRKEYEKLLDSVPMLKSLELYERMNLCDALMPKHFKKKELIIRQGAKADGMYFIEEGSVRITMIMNEGPERGKEVEMSCLHKGQYFGELALVTHKPRAASVYAASDVKLAFLDVHAFERLLGPCMNIMRRNIDDYEKQVVAIFGSKANISDLR